MRLPLQRIATANSGKQRQTPASGVGVETVIVGAIGVALAITAGVLLIGPDPTAGAAIPAALAVVLVAVISPFWALVITAVQFAFLPAEGSFAGAYVPNLLQFLAPLAVIAALFKALKDGYHSALKPRLADFAVAGFGLWGLVGKFATSGIISQWYGNRMLMPMLLYFAARLLKIDRSRLRTMMYVFLAAIAVQSVLMIGEGLTGSSPLYHAELEALEGAQPAKGPFRGVFSAGAYLAIWPPLFIWAIANSRTRLKKVVWTMALVFTFLALTRTMQRAALAGAVLGVLCCLPARKLRKTVIVVLCALAFLSVPWSLTGGGEAVLNRFDQVDQSRYARRVAAINILKSSDWDPLLGIGWNNYGNIAGKHGTDEQITAYGTRQTTVSAIAGGAALHNVWYAIPVEFGLGGVLFALLILFAVTRTAAVLWRSGSNTPAKDDGLWIAMLAGLIALGGDGYYHNIYDYAASMSVLWLFYGLLIAHPTAFVDDGRNNEEDTKKAQQ